MPWRGGVASSVSQFLAITAVCGESKTTEGFLCESRQLCWRSLRRAEVLWGGFPLAADRLGLGGAEASAVSLGLGRRGCDTASVDASRQTAALESSCCRVQGRAGAGES